MASKNDFALEFAPIARHDLDEILVYVGTELQAPDAAANLIDKIEAAILRIPQFPYQWPITRDAVLANRGYRMLPVESFAVFYLVDSDRKVVSIRRILYGKRNFRWLL